MVKRILFFLFCLSAAGLCAQQNPYYTLTGTVLDETGQPMVGASVADRISMAGDATDKNGRFELKLREFPIFLEVSFIGYAIDYREIKETDFGADRRLDITIRMEPRSQQLLPATIEGKRYEEFYVHRNIAVLDFTFVDDYTLLLLREGIRDYKLALINEAEDSLANLDIDVAAKSFVEDCLGHIYMQGNNAVHGLSFAGNKIHMIGSIDNNWFETKVKPCVASNPHNLYYQFLQFGNQMLDVFQTPMAGGDSKLIKRIVDMDDALSIQEYGLEAAAMMNGVNRMGDIGVKDLGRAKKAWDNMQWYKRILTIPVYHPLFATQEGAFLFDHLNDSVLVLDVEGEVTERYFINHHKNKDFVEEILQDVVTGIFYARYEHAGIVTLMELSQKDFSPIRGVEIRKFDFPCGLKIRNGVAYFLDHSDEDYQKLKLYRQKL
ncbi:MAG TPA: hypothetical protein DCG19_04885 [Cryomorphaceae bacterium]|nr:hypothetical protein [Owenweeksia sp.]MBF99271.1 hypothetical protein [Owenweeksia sp.]HAD96718.1 hypothetical protein [Cryomorphaceae bacterium]HBF21427.1 hypothetical protein [Cryomorphaceae bacterium]|tara:strand:+ start:384 stop:1688 length:1305 start_codon:yes stop_codon:yes gene_type:complete